MKKKIIATAILALIATTNAYAGGVQCQVDGTCGEGDREAVQQTVLSCTGEAFGMNEFADGPGQYPVEVNLTKNANGYSLQYIGPANSARNTSDGFSALIGKNEYKQIAYTTGAQLRIQLVNQHPAYNFSLEVNTNRLAHQITAHLGYFDGKAISLHGDLVCTMH